jgi:hypothetical protein
LLACLPACCLLCGAGCALRRWEQAEADLRKAAALRPGWAEPLLTLAAMLAEGPNRTVEAAKVYAAAFAAEPRQAENLNQYHRYNAACFAARAGAGSGSDAAGLDETQKAKLRQQALEWLKAVLQARQQWAGSAQGRARLGKDLSGWLSDADLASVREKAELARLAAEERSAWEKLWAEVAALLRKAQARTK